MKYDEYGVDLARLFDPIEVGDVLLNTKLGILVTVNDVTSFHPQVECVWFDDQDTVHHAPFPSGALIPLELMPIFP